ncbi:phosphate acetyltransferase [Phytophthora infestans T30-4]|uniref:Phosphate acetyltransferase n=2 Tax=Phytophthora infestans TaxID=4787 RepID=D0NQ84_PHYIT|nr:phosphate acetyltransferase [Phytophthora infestans T30-4]EEY62816.1 phosphate acetyltransferase [Phytophthora infestans T30-4]KAF4046178.1 Phosphate acetyl/butaryl transferase [Phytophthora infestans]|eukprot:XP_002898691.1 phosphate acetyltransferase [Phytophthora infestans T30-4]
MWTLRNTFRRTSVALPSQRRALTAAAIAEGKVPINNLFVTSTEVTEKTAPVLIGLTNTLEQKFARVGYFRPIQPIVETDHHVDVMKQQLGLTKSVEQLYGVTSERAIEYWLNGKGDDLVEEILDRYEACREGHDFMIIEGSQLSKHESAMSWKINVDIAKAIGSPVLTISDFSESANTNSDLLEEILSRTAFNKDQVEGAGLNFIGNIANRVNTKDPKALREAIRAKLREKDLPFLGFLPKDDFIASKRLNEVTHQLGAKQLFGTKAIPNNVVVTSAVVATSALKDLFAHLKNYKDGALVITSADRSDVMLGLMASRLPGILPNVSAIVLTNGSYPHSNTQEILQGVEALDKTGLSIPIFSVPEDTFTTADKFSKVSTDILPTSQLKIDRSKQLFDEFVGKEGIIGELDEGMVVNRSPKQFQHFLFSKSRAVQRHIVLTEGEDIRVLQAADQVLRQKLSKVTILGNPDDIERHAKSLTLDLSRANIVRTADSELLDKYVDQYFEKRKHKGVTRESARDAVLEETCFGTMMVEMGDADGMVSGACHTTANTIRPALQLIKTTPNRPIVSSIFFMCLEDGVRIYGDCAVNTDPSAQDLAQIAVTSAESAEAFGLIPKVALLSYATGDSNSGPIIDKVREATKMAQELRPDLDIYGPIQYDAAVDESIAKTKLKAIPSGAKVGGQANVLIFPDLNTGNNTYKAVQQSTGCIAMGPMLQGLRKPVNDLSRGATVKDIVTTVAITAIQADQVILKREAKAKVEAAA